MTCGANATDFPSADACFAAEGPVTTATGMRSGGFSRNANPRASASSSGKPKTQTIASVSRTNSFVRALVSSMIAGRTLSDIAELPTGQRNEEVLERCGVRRQRDELRARLLDCSEKLGHRLRERVDAQLIRAAVRRAALASRQITQRLLRQRRIAAEFDDVARLELCDQLLRSSKGDQVAVVDDGDAVTKALRFLHVVRRQQNGASFRS